LTDCFAVREDLAKRRSSLVDRSWGCASAWARDVRSMLLAITPRTTAVVCRISAWVWALTGVDRGVLSGAEPTSVGGNAGRSGSGL